jgi:hypothetical protein
MFGRDGARLHLPFDPRVLSCQSRHRVARTNNCIHNLARFGIFQALGLATEGDKLRSATSKPSPSVRRKKSAPSIPVERRESSRTKAGSVNYTETEVDVFFGPERYRSVPFCRYRGCLASISYGDAV